MRRSKTYANPQGHLASSADTRAFGPFPAGGPALAGSSRPAPGIPSPALIATQGRACVPSDEVLCLGRGRFALTAFWRDFQGKSGVGHAVELTPDTGTFWFFWPSNVELVVKVLDGRSVNSRFWLFSGALSSVEYVLQVTDTTTGRVRVYRNPPGTLASLADTSAFEDEADPSEPARVFDRLEEALRETDRATLFQVSEDLAELAVNLESEVNAALDCLQSAAAGSTRSCPGFDPHTGRWSEVTVTRDEARWLASLLATGTLFTELAEGVTAAFDDAKPFQVLGTLCNDLQVQNVVSLFTQTALGVLRRAKVPARLLQQLAGSVGESALKRALPNGDFQSPPIFVCSSPLSTDLATARLEVTRGGGVRVEGQTLHSEAREAAGRLHPELTRAAPWRRDGLGRTAARFEVRPEVCAGSGAHRLETFTLPRQTAPSSQMVVESYYLDCEGSLSFHGKTVYVPGRAPAPTSRVDGRTAQRLTRCDGQWNDVPFSFSFDFCGPPYSQQCSMEGTVEGRFSGGVLHWDAAWTGSGVDPAFEKGPLELEIDLRESGSYDVTSGVLQGRYKGLYIWEVVPSTCSLLATVAEERFAFTFAYPPRPPACRWVDRCPE